MKDRILIFGGGFIGGRLQEAFHADACDTKIHSLQDAQKEIERRSPKIIINCIGYIGRNVDDCELNKDKAIMSNAFIPIILAEAALRNKIKLVHISTGCIYHFDYALAEPIDEEREADFLDLFYSRTKIYAEKMLEVLAKRCPILIVRPRIPLDNRPHPRNILTKLVASGKVIDTPNSVTYIPDFIEAIKHLIAIEATGIYHIVNRGALKYPLLLEAYKKYVPDFTYSVVEGRELGGPRANLILSTKKLEQSGFKTRDIKEVIEECLKAYLKY